MRSKSTSATVNNLKPSTAYVFQIRAFTEAGYGTFGPRLEITTKEETTGRVTADPSQVLLLIALLQNHGLYLFGKMCLLVSSSSLTVTFIILKISVFH